ncbi:hypothetical protein PLESTF_001713900 [Pleodorina starrii]|nr:hypothetical protein PLESTF_001713900 [Pleodorina starrii]
MQSYKAGWSKPMPGGHISAAADLRLGVPRELTLPPMYSSKRNFVRIITDLKVNYPIVGQAEANFKQRALYVAYRPGVNGPGAYDSGLAAFPPRNSLVWVHEFNDTDDRYPTFNENDAPNFLAALSGEAAPDAILDWSDLPKFDGILVYRSFRQTFPGLGGIAITYKSHTPQAAQVIVCRFSESKETSCGDGNDNDCRIQITAAAAATVTATATAAATVTASATATVTAAATATATATATASATVTASATATATVTAAATATATATATAATAGPVATAPFKAIAAATEKSEAAS